MKVKRKMSYSKPRDGTHVPAHERMSALYNSCLRRNPILTKSCTCAFTAILGDFIGQKMSKQAYYELRKTLAFALFGFFGTGPLTHTFYKQLSSMIPPRMKYSQVYKLVIERLVFAPLFLLLFFYAVPILQGKGLKVAQLKVKKEYWSALKANWKVWTLFQYFNINYIPVQYQTIAASFFSLFWNIYLSMKQA